MVKLTELNKVLVGLFSEINGANNGNVNKNKKIVELLTLILSLFKKELETQKDQVSLRNGEDKALETDISCNNDLIALFIINLQVSFNQLMKYFADIKCIVDINDNKILVKTDDKTAKFFYYGQNIKNIKLTNIIKKNIKNIL